MNRIIIFICMHLRCCILLVSALLVCLFHPASAQQANVLREADFGQFNQVFLNDSLWFYHSGELPTNKRPALETIGWDTLRHTNLSKDVASRHWRGMGWFGFWLRADTGLVNKKLFIGINHDGASEIFLDGKPIGGYGKVGYSAMQMQAVRAPRDLIPIWLADTKPHLLAIRYSNFFGVYPDFWGFQLSMGNYDKRAEKMSTSKKLLDYLPMFAAAQIILALLHFLFFLFYPRQKLNAYYALFVFLIGMNGIAVHEYYLTPYPTVQYFADFMTSIFKVLIMWAAVVLLYVLNYRRIPRWRMAGLTGITLFYLIGYSLKFWVFRGEIWADNFSIVYVICMLDGLWSAANVIKRGQKDAWLIGIGVGAIILVFIFAWNDMFAIWPYGQNSMRLFVMGAGSLVMPLCSSLYLALDFARTNEKLIEKLHEVERLSARSIAQETEKTELMATEARRLEQLVEFRTAELKAQTQKLRELDAVKSHFFTNITHEFKTPLTLIRSPARELLNGSGVNPNENLRLIIRNADRLLQLINQLLDLSKIESGLMNVNLAPVDLVAMIKLHVFSYTSMAIQKGIALDFTTSLDALWMMTDRDKMDKVILNILSNAFKFTDEGTIGITLGVDQDDLHHNLILTVLDTGKGISPTKLPYIFTRFYQADPSDTRSAEGTGIGLSLTKELVELLGGQISVESTEDLFTQIRIDMPYEEAEPIAKLETELLVTEFNKTAEAGKEEVEVGKVLIGDEVLIADEGSPQILLIEDHPELREFIRQSLVNKFRLITASNGEEGIAMALTHIPNLIITDLMMPKVSGYEVCETLKNDEKTSHIPIIILTAKAALESRLQGIETGADAYLAKPFDQQELLAYISNLINVREQLRLHYAGHDLWLKNTIDLPSIEQDFIHKIRHAVETHLNEEGYNGDQLAADMALSRTQLHRKLKGLIGQSPGELIRIIRLQYAHNLLERRVATVSEVAYMVGFSSPASFSTSFSHHFGFAPSKVAVTRSKV